jgi:hypothetical protein
MGKLVLTMRKNKLHISQSCPMYLVKHSTIKTCQTAAEQLLSSFLTWVQREVNCRLEAPASLLFPLPP